MKTLRIGMAMLAMIGWTQLAWAQVRPIGRVPATGRVAQASHCSSCASGGATGYIGQSYLASAPYDACGCGGTCGSCALCAPSCLGGSIVCGAVGLVGELVCDVKHVVDTGVSHVVGCLLPCGGCCPPSAGCVDCGGGCDSGVVYEGASGGCSNCSSGYEMVPQGAPAPAAAPAPTPAADPFQDDPVGNAQAAVRRQAGQRAAMADRASVADNRYGARSARVNQAGYRLSRPEISAATRYQPNHQAQLRRLSNTARSNNFQAYSQSPSYR